MITGDEIDALIEVSQILKPLSRVIVEVCYEKYVTFLWFPILKSKLQLNDFMYYKVILVSIFL